MKERKSIVWTSLNERTKQRIREIAEERQTTVSAVIREALLFFLERVTTKEQQKVRSK